MSGACATLSNISFNLATVAAGTARGTRNPVQFSHSNPGAPYSAMVGKSGSNLERLPVRTPIGRTLPDLI